FQAAVAVRSCVGDPLHFGVQPALDAGGFGDVFDRLFDGRRGVAGRFDAADDRGQNLGFIGFDFADETEQADDAAQDAVGDHTPRTGNNLRALLGAFQFARYAGVEGVNGVGLLGRRDGLVWVE